MNEQVRVDAAWVEEQLSLLMPEIIAEDYPERTYSRAFKTPGGLSPGMQSVTHLHSRGTGKARIVDGNSREVPLVGYDVQPRTTPVKLIRLGFDYTQHEVRQGQFAGVPLDREKARVCMEGHEEQIDRMAWAGDSARQVFGLVNHPNILRLVTSTTIDSSSTPAQILAALNLALAKQTALTNGIEKPDCLALPPEQAKYIAQTPYSATGAGDVRTIAEVFLAGNPEIKEIMPVYWLAASSGAVSSDVMVAFNRSQAKIQHMLAMVPTRNPVAWDGVAFRVVIESASGGLMIAKPFSVIVTEGI